MVWGAWGWWPVHDIRVSEKYVSVCVVVRTCMFVVGLVFWCEWCGVCGVSVVFVVVVCVVLLYVCVFVFEVMKCQCRLVVRT